jgi:hypothetical protein
MTSNAVVVAAPPPVAPDVAGKLDPRVGVFAGMPLVALALALALAFVARRLRRR